LNKDGNVVRTKIQDREQRINGLGVEIVDADSESGYEKAEEDEEGIKKEEKVLTT
jgi:hypothetical protein